jgi:hypothetical protein
MPHRDATHATLARVTQLRGRIVEIDVRAVGSVVEPTSLAGAMAERERLELLLLALERAANAVTKQGASAVVEHDELAPMVIQDRPPSAEAVVARRRVAKLAFLVGGATSLIMLLLLAWAK